MEKCEEILQSQSKYKAEMDAKMIQLQGELHPLNENKLDTVKFNEFVKTQTKKHKDLRTQVDTMTSDVASTSNYVQKYVPMQLQRAITHVLGFVFPQKDVAWRLNWYNEDGVIYVIGATHRYLVHRTIQMA